MNSKRVRWVVAGALACAAAGGAAWALLRKEPTTGLAYHTPPGGAPLTLDIDYPPAGRGPFAVVVFVPHDAEWHPDFKQEDRIRLAIEVLTRGGYAVATVHYRPPGKCQFPEPLRDAKAAVRWLRANAARYKLDPDRVGAVGASAGGYGAALLGTTGPEDGFDPPGDGGGASCRVRAVAVLAGPTDLTRRTWPEVAERSYLRPFLGGGFSEKPEAYRKASPGTYATPDDPPFLLLHSPTDPMVSFSHAKGFADQLRAGGVAVRVVELRTVFAHIPEGPELERTLEQIVPFFDEHLKG